MKKLMTLGCAFFFVFCMTKKPTVKTDGLEEVVVFGEDTTTQLPTEEAAIPPVEPPPVAETVAPPPVAAEEVTIPPVAETVTPPPIEEVASASPVVPPPVVPTTVSEEPVLSSIPAAAELAAAPEPTPPPIAAMVPTSAVPAAPQGSVYGFRVQIFASSTEKNAMKIVDDARTAFGGRIYIEHLAPYFKVRIGDCLTKEDALVLKDKAVSQGYRGAFVVETMINP
jgi:hypothetical protein